MQTVLIVDNQPLILRFVKGLVEERGHRALIAADGLQALDILERETPDLVFVDLVMPNIDGRKLCKMIRSNPCLSNTKLVILSAIAIEDPNNLQRLEADLYIAKGPLPQMAKHIQAVLDDTVFSVLPRGGVLGADTLLPRDITSELLSTKRHLELILEHMSEGILEISPDGRVVFANPSSTKLLGVGDLEVLGKRAADLLSGGEGWNPNDLIPRVLATRTKSGSSTPFRLGDRWVKLEILPLVGESGGAMAILTDVTEIQRRGELLALTLDGAPLPATMIDTDHRVILWNRAMEQLTGVSRKEVLGRPPNSSIFYPGPPRPLLVDLVLEMDQEGIRLRYGPEGVKRHPVFPEAFEGRGKFLVGGKQRTLHFTAARIRDWRGRVIGAIETIQDDTEREELQRQLQHAQKMQAVGTLAAGMAHEFNNILAAIQGYAQLMGFELGPEDPNVEYVKEIQASCQRAAGLIRKMLSFSRLEQGERLPVKLNQVAEGVAQMLRQTLPPKIQVHLDLQPGLPFVMGEHSQLEQVILNLGLNARDALSGSGEIRISTRERTLEEGFCRAHPWARPGRYVEVGVEDNGIGMPPEVLERVFEPFFTTKEPGKGTGLGLTIAYSIVKSHNGYILAESPAGSGIGSRFRVFLPVVEEIEEEQSTGVDGAKLPRGRGERVLLVDDEVQLLQIGAKMLSSSGYRADVVLNGEEALRLYAEAIRQGDPYRLVMLDLAMPVMDGRECMARILELDPKARVLIATGGPMDARDRDEIPPGALGVLQKPFRLEALLESVREALERP